ncbi:MAG: SDR family oxidoreductase [Oceanipulchritudo sp.]
MDIAIVTGASSALGLAVSRRLIQLGFRVYGLGGDYKDCPLQNVNFKPVSCDLGDPSAVEEAAHGILEKEKGVYVLVNNAKYFGQKRFAEMEISDMERVLRINLLCPLVLVRTLAGSLRNLQGYLINLGAPYSDFSRGGPVGASASGGLKWMGEVLFHDLRDYGVKVCHLSPEPNRGRDPRSLVRPGARMEASIDPEAVAQAIEQILQSPFGNVITELVMRPLRVREPEQEPVRNLPYPEPQPIPYTVPREIIEAEEQLEEEEWQENQHRKRKRRREKKAVNKQPDAGEAPAREESPTAPVEAKTGSNAPEKRKKGGRKPRPQKPNVGFIPREKASDPQPPPESRPEETKEDRPPAKKAGRKTARKRTAKKTAKKATAKKATRNPVQKAARKQSAKKETKKAESGRESAQEP